MLLTISTTHVPATDLGYLLYKNPDSIRSVELWFGEAHVFYPEATATVTCPDRGLRGHLEGLGVPRRR